ncbi:MAG: hypothetical protein Q8Q36_01615 [bacterium]|nr:hypothetical protein [bacterium]
MARNEMSPVALFKRFQPRFREIAWHPAGFICEYLDEKPTRERWLRKERIQLAPGYLGQKGPIGMSYQDSEGQVEFPLRSFWWYERAPTGELESRYTSFHVRKGGLRFNFSFDPASALDMGDQFEAAVVRTLYEGPFKGKRFFMDPGKHAEDPIFTRPPLHFIPVKFSTDGKSIPGLDLCPATAATWEFFIPEGPERKAIRAAVELENTRNAQEEYHAKDPSRKRVREIMARLENSLASIPL